MLRLPTHKPTESCYSRRASITNRANASQCMLSFFGCLNSFPSFACGNAPYKAIKTLRCEKPNASRSFKNMDGIPTASQASLTTPCTALNLNPSASKEPFNTALYASNPSSAILCASLPKAPRRALRSKARSASSPPPANKELLFRSAIASAVPLRCATTINSTKTT